MLHFPFGALFCPNTEHDVNTVVLRTVYLTLAVIPLSHGQITLDTLVREPPASDALDMVVRHFKKRTTPGQAGARQSSA